MVQPSVYQFRVIISFRVVVIFQMWLRLQDDPIENGYFKQAFLGLGQTQEKILIHCQRFVKFYIINALRNNLHIQKHNSN